MKKFFILCLVALGLSSCAKADRNMLWVGDKEVPAEGGTVVWKPFKNKNLFPDIMDIAVFFYNSDGYAVDSNITKTDSERVIKDHYEKFEGEGYEIVASLKSLSLKLTPNETPYRRDVNITFTDGYTLGINMVAVTQQSINPANN